METAQRAAMAIRSCYGWRGVPDWEQLVLAAIDAGARIDDDAPLPAPMREVYIDGLRGVRGLIALQSGLPMPWKRWLLAHALGHKLLHRGNHFYLETVDDGHWVDAQEHEAEAFAGYLLLADDHDRVVSTEDALDLAFWADVPFPCVARWLRLSAPSLVGCKPPRTPGGARLHLRALRAALPTTDALYRVVPAGVAATISLGLGLRLMDLNHDGFSDIVRGLSRLATGVG